MSRNEQNPRVGKVASSGHAGISLLIGGAQSTYESFHTIWNDTGLSPQWSWCERLTEGKQEAWDGGQVEHCAPGCCWDDHIHHQSRHNTNADDKLVDAAQRPTHPGWSNLQQPTCMSTL